MPKILSRPVFSTNQFNRSSNIFDNAGQIVLGVAVIAPIISGFKLSNLPVVLSGIIVVLYVGQQASGLPAEENYNEL